MTRDLGPSLFQCLITKSVCCLHEGLTCCRFSYRWSEVSVHRRLAMEDGHRFMSVTCLILPPTFPRGPRWRRSGHTSFRPVGMLLDPLTHTHRYFHYRRGCTVPTPIVTGKWENRSYLCGFWNLISLLIEFILFDNLYCSQITVLIKPVYFKSCEGKLAYRLFINRIYLL